MGPNIRTYVFDEVIKLVGVGNAFHIATGWGGGTLYVPKEFSYDHPLTLAIGPNAAKRMIDEYAATYLDIPPERRVLRSRREALICDELRSGQTIGDTARKYGMSHNAIRNMCLRNKIKRPPQ